ncbi:MAG: ABC transporter substrate-binding protein [Cytophagales bacterium]|nr:ABC transporter substrate-binding protein [Cytophagales bacterium]
MTFARRQPTRRQLLSSSFALAGAATSNFFPSTSAAQTLRTKLRVGFMLPYTGTFAQLGVAIENGFHLALLERGGKIAGREVEFFKVDDESDPAKAIENASKLVQRDKVDVLVGSVHSGVQLGIQKVARESGVLNIIPTAALHAATRLLCAPNVFRTSYTSYQQTYALGAALLDKGLKRVVWISWKYTAGEEMLEGFREGFEPKGGLITKELWAPFPSVEFQALLTEVAALKPDAVACFFAGAGAAKFMKDYAAAGLKGKIPLYGAGTLTEGTLEAARTAAEGVVTTMHYSDALDTPRNKAFRLAYAKQFKMQPDVYAVQGYDSADLLDKGLLAVGGDINKKAALYKAMEAAVIDSPRGKWKMSSSHNPVQDIYLRVVKNGENKVLGLAIKGLSDPGTGCKM